MLKRLATMTAAALFLSGGVSIAQEQGAKAAAHAPKAMASSGHPLVTQAMLDVLKRGGNAMDAALTGAVMQTVVQPQMVTLAGALSALYYDAKTGEYHYLDAELDHTASGAPIVPGWAQVTGGGSGLEATSGRLIGVPGMVAGMKAAADRFGTLKWSQYFAPSIRVADNGFPMYSFLYGEMADAAMTRLAAYPSGREEFLPKGYVPPVGTTVTRPRLAATMRRLASDGPDYFYTGEWGRKFVAEVRNTGGAITQEDMSAYRPRWQTPLRSSFKGREIITPPPPSTAGSLIAMVLNIAEPWDFKAMPHYTQSAAALQRLRQAFAFAEDFTDGYIQDPASFDVPTDILLSKSFAAQLTGLIDGAMPKASITGKVAQQDGLSLAGGFDHSDPHASDTDHIVVIDKDGNVVSLTHSVQGTTFGTGLVVDGVVVNSGNYFPGKNLGEGRRVVSGFSPTMVAQGGAPTLALGSPGLTSRAVALTLINHFGYGLSLEQSVDAPRFQGAQASRALTIEGRLSEQTRADMKAHYGASLKVTTPYNWHFGSIQAVARQPDGSLIGVADPRRGGFAAGY